MNACGEMLPADAIAILAWMRLGSRCSQGGHKPDSSMHAPSNPEILPSCGSSSYAPGKQMVECRSASSMPLGSAALGVDLTNRKSHRCMYVLDMLYRI